ncbi:hypothetical protein GEMRC1_004803 [Eukaryota sp. GEM-RC1]
MRLITVFLSLALYCLAAESLGGFHTNTEFNDPDIVEALTHSISHINSINGESLTLDDVHVISVKTQVVAGMIYKIHLAVPDHDAIGKHFEMQVFRDLSGHFSVEQAKYIGMLPIHQ